MNTISDIEFYKALSQSKSHRMMKYMFILFIGIVIFSCGKKKTENDQPENKVIRKVKELREFTHEPYLKAGKIEYRSKIAEYSFIMSSVFNVEGALIKESRFNSKGNLEWKAINKYDTHGNIIERDVYNPTGYLISKKINMFNSSGKLIGSNEFDEGENLIGKQTSSIDSRGNQIIVTYKVIKDAFVKTEENVYDMQGHNIENSHFINGSLESKDIHDYDSLGNRIESIEFYPLRNEQNVTLFKYDKENNKIEEVLIRNNLITSKLRSRYDDKNNVVETLTYDVLGNLIAQQKHQYQYDDANNWIRQIIMINNNPTSVILHQIEYY